MNSYYNGGQRLSSRLRHTKNRITTRKNKTEQLKDNNFHKICKLFTFSSHVYVNNRMDKTAIKNIINV